MKYGYAVFIWLTLAASLPAESRPRDSSHPQDVPQFSVGLRVRWSDGSRGCVVGQAQWLVAATAGQWHYPIQFGGSESLCWLLPEQGLELIEE